MSPEAQRIAIAEACPALRWWKDCESAWHFPGGARMCGGSCLTDLNAMHEAEKVLTEDQHALFRVQLSIWCDYHSGFSATAAQRAEAFLRTLGKWEESA